MKSKVTVTIAQREYTLISDEGEAYVEKVAGWITPVPGGVGPMTITMLLQNTIKAAQLSKEND